MASLTPCLFKKKIARESQKKESFSISELCKVYLPNLNLQNLHNAVEDNKVLKNLLDVTIVTNECIKNESKSITFIQMEKMNKKIIACNQMSLEIYKDRINKRILNKMAKGNITRTILKDTYKKMALKE